MKNQIARTALAILIFLSFGGCDLLDVENPNNLEESQLGDPTTSQAMANGLKSSVARALGYQLAPYGMVTDELTWIGSRDGWQELDFGNHSRQLNEFSDLAFPYMAEAEWHARTYIGRMEAFQEAGTLPSEESLAQAYLYGAVIYTSLADMYDNYAFSDKTEPGPAVGEESMVELYTTALDWVTNAQALSAGFEAELAAMEARIRFSRSLWEHVQPPIQTGQAALVRNAEAKAAAEAALNLMGADELFELPIQPGASFESYVAQQVNGRLEMRVGDAYVESTEDGDTFQEVIYEDPVDGVIHPYVEQIITQRYPNAGNNFANITFASAREMHLIIAEYELANSNPSGFDTAISALRALDGLSSYDGSSGISRIDLLEDSRQANLFFQGRRLKDLYRFEGRTPAWIDNGDAVQSPGTFFPITATEVRANPNLSFD